MLRSISRAVRGTYRSSYAIGSLKQPLDQLTKHRFRSHYTTDSATSYQDVSNKIDEGKVVLVSATYCPFCHQAKRLADQAKFSDTTVYEVDTLDAGSQIRDGLTERTEGHSTVPFVFVGGEFIGGATEMMNQWGMGVLQEKLDKAGVTYEDDE